MHLDGRIGARLKLRDLHILMIVAQAGSMAKAAKQLAVSQPAVSKAVADVEHALNVRLLDRSSRGIEVNQYGRAIITRGLAAFDELRQGVKEIQFLSDPSAGEVRLGTGEGLASALVPSVIESLSSKHPLMTFQILTGERATQLEGLRDRKIEFSICRLHDIPQDEFKTQVLYDEVFVVVAGAKNPLSRARKIKLADVILQPWALPPLDTSSGFLIQKAFLAKGLKLPRSTVFTFSQQLRLNLVAAGRFLTVLPDYLMRAAERPPAVRLLPVALPETRRQIGIVSLKSRALSPAAQIFIDHVCKVSRQIWTD